MERKILPGERLTTHAQRTSLYRALGVDETVSIDVFTIPLQAGDRLLLCSDGLWEQLTSQDLCRCWLCLIPLNW